MINHVRTLLLNPAAPGVSSHYVGDEFVPTGYGQLAIPSKFDRVRKIVFGPAADRYMMNYRLAEIMTLLHTTELEEFVLELDSRVTYWPPTKRGIFDAAFGVTVVSEHSTAGSYATIQEIVQESVSGQLYEEWHVTVGAGSTFTIRRNSKPSSTTTGSFTLTGGLSEGISLQGSNLLIRLENPSNGDSYLVKSLKRPKHDLAAIAEQLRTGMGAETQAELFYRTSEPFKTFSNLWFDHDQLAYKFGGLILALVYHLDELRTGAAV
jgi:hypothetical protein